MFYPGCPQWGQTLNLLSAYKRPSVVSSMCHSCNASYEAYTVETSWIKWSLSRTATHYAHPHSLLILNRFLHLSHSNPRLAPVSTPQHHLSPYPHEPFTLLSCFILVYTSFTSHPTLHPLTLCIPHPNRAAGTLIGQGVTEFITDWDKVSATALGLTLFAFGIYSARMGAGLIGRWVGHVHIAFDMCICA